MIYVVMGPSGGGKSTIVDAAIRDCKNISRVVTCTTREMRNGEVDGVTYNFLTESQFKEYVKKGEFIEHTSYANNLYGTRCSDIENAMKSGNDVVLIMDSNGLCFIKERYSDVLSICITRDKESLVRAIMERDTSNKTKTERINQLNIDEKNAGMCDIIIKNVDLEKTISIFKKIVG